MHIYIPKKLHPSYKYKEVMDFEKGKSLREKQDAEIGKELSIPWSTISSLCNTLQTTKPLKTSYKQGWPYASSISEDCPIIQTTKDIHHLYIALHDITNAWLSIWTIKWWLNEERLLKMESSRATIINWRKHQKMDWTMQNAFNTGLQMIFNVFSTLISVLYYLIIILA